jgi:hypothetical protein
MEILVGWPTIPLDHSINTFRREIIIPKPTYRIVQIRLESDPLLVSEPPPTIKEDNFAPAKLTMNQVSQKKANDNQIKQITIERSLPPDRLNEKHYCYGNTHQPQERAPKHSVNSPKLTLQHIEPRGHSLEQRIMNHPCSSFP